MSLIRGSSNANIISAMKLPITKTRDKIKKIEDATYISIVLTDDKINGQIVGIAKTIATSISPSIK